jgi:hypothetical protein
MGSLGPRTVHHNPEPSTTILGTTVIRVRGLDSGTARHSANRAPRIYRCTPGHALKCGGPYLTLCAFSCRSWLRCPLQSRMSNHSPLHRETPRIQPEPLPDPDRNSSWEAISSFMAWWLFCYLTDLTTPCDGVFPSPPRSWSEQDPVQFHSPNSHPEDHYSIAASRPKSTPLFVNLPTVDTVDNHLSSRLHRQPDPLVNILLSRMPIVASLARSRSTAPFLI